jgi:hypothetical protein
MGVPVNGASFGADRAFAPTGHDTLFGLPPVMLALLALLGLALFALGWFLKEAQAPRRRDDADAIWKAVDDALKAAMKADGAALIGKAEDLKTVIDKRLGATLKLAGGLAGPVAALKAALEGQAHESHGHDDPRGDHADHGHGDHGHGGAHHGDHAAETRHEAGPVTQVTIINGAPAHGGDGHGGDHGGGHKPLPLTPRERDHALRLAVADLNEHWRHKADRIDELRAACRELSAD